MALLGKPSWFASPCQDSTNEHVANVLVDTSRMLEIAQCGLETPQSFWYPFRGELIGLDLWHAKILSANQDQSLYKV